MNYGDLIRLYFERSTALQWYWTIYIVVIGGILGFSTLRQRPETVTAILVTVLFVCFAYKNLGAIEATLTQQQAIRSVIAEYPAAGPNEEDIKRVRAALEPQLSLSESVGVWYFHMTCNLLTIAAVWAKEWRRRENLAHPPTAAA
jgi:hypothetical protein